MKSSILNIVFVLTVTCLLIVEAQQQGCRCGDLGLGKNPCSCSKTVVKAVELPKPTYYASPQEINAAAAVRKTAIAYQLPVPSQTGCSNSQSLSIPINPTSVTYVDSNANTYNSQSDSLPYSGGSDLNAKSNGNLNTYSSSSSDSSSYSGSSLNALSDSNSNSYSGSTVYSNTASTTYGATKFSSSASPLPLPSGYSNSNSGCGCNKRIVESLDSIETDDSINSNGNVVPRFSPIGDLCYPLPNSRSEALIERTKVTPAYPGKILCNSCNKTPYEICVNALTGETTSRKTVSKPFGTTGGSSNPPIPIIYGKSNFAVPRESISGTYPATGIRRTGLVAGSASGSRSYGNFNSESSFGAYGSSNFGSSSRSTSGIFSLPSLAHANLNTANGQKQYAKVSTSSSFSNCDDDIDESQVDYSYPEVPADAVSLTLAYKNLRAPNVIYRQGKQFVPEDKLSFGHRTLPNDVKSNKHVPDVPEEKLVTVEKPVVELKIAPPRTIVIGSYDEREEAKLAELEAIERESIKQEETADQVADGLLTYKDLGYAPVGSTYRQSQSYDGIIQGEMNDSSEEPCGPLGPPVPDYIPGSVVVQQDVLENEGCDNNKEISQTTQFRQANPSGFRSYSM